MMNDPFRANMWKLGPGGYEASRLVGNARQRRQFQRATARAFGAGFAASARRLYGKHWASLCVFDRSLIMRDAK
jgi:hypothetical protein